MRVIRKGTFDKQGNPIHWHIDMNGQGHDGQKYAVGVINEKVLVNGIEIVEWTEERNRCAGKSI